MKQPARTVSIRGITLRYLAIILLTAVTGVVVIAAVGSYSSREATQRHEAFELDVIRADIGGLVDFYRQIAEALARQQEVADILQFGDIEQAVLWAKEVRSTVPESIGVALVEPSGEVMGEPLQLQLGTQCVSDLKDMLQGKPLSMPPVHRGMPTLQHFDVIVPVTYAGESLGLLFISFSLDVLERRIDRHIGSEQYLAIRDSTGLPVAQGGSRGLVETAAMPVVAISGTDWLLYYSAGERGEDRLLVLAIAIGGVIFAVTILLTLFLSARVFRFFSADLNLIRDQLDRVHSGADTIPLEDGTRLRETAKIMADVSELVKKIQLVNSRLKRESLHDGLTGLYNRRAFDEALVHYSELACRGNRARLVLLDLDLFKKVNDQYGHGVGDEVLIALAESLRERCRSSDILARLGGDEFAAILSGSVEHDLQTWFTELEQRFVQKQARINGGEGIDPHCRISAGGVVIDERSGRDVKALLAQADRKLYEAKGAGRGKICS